jgi:hypothetical protein
VCAWRKRCGHLTDAAHGRPWDAFYTTHNLRSFENLRAAPADAPERWLAAALA